MPSASRATLERDLLEAGALVGGGNTLSAAFMRRRGAVLWLSMAALVAIALADIATGYELALSILYVGPVVAATWAFGLRAGLALSVLATAAWFATDAFADHHYSRAIFRYWEGFIRLATFVLFAVMVDQLKRALARSDDRLIKVLEGLDAAVCVIDPVTGMLLYQNQPFDEAFAGERRQRAVQSLLDTRVSLREGEEAGEELHFENRWYLVRGRWLHWTDGRPVRLLSATDVTARHDAEALNREQEAKLQTTARLVAVGEIASSIAHELNQPLAAISSYVRGSLRRLRAGGADTEALAGALEQAGEQAERAGQIIRRVRDFVSARTPVLAELDLKAVAAQAAGALAHEAGRGGLHIALDVDDGLPRALADAVMIEQVVLNLLRNAVEAMGEGGPGRRQIDLRISATRDGMLEVAVADRGPGIGSEAAGRLFEPFFTTKPEGMGLGLNICRSIVEFHGGRLWMVPRDGGGTEFHFTVCAAGSPA